MKVLFISTNTEMINMPTLPLGLAFVATATECKGHQVELIDLMPGEDTGAIIEKAMEEFEPGLIGVSVRNIDDQNMEDPKFLLDHAREVVEACKGSSNVPVVLGGAGYSIFPEKALEYLGADMGIQGEGEIPMPLLIQYMEQGRSLSQVPGLYLPGRGLQGKRCFARDLDRFPLPRIEFLQYSSYQEEDVWVPVQTRRGCPMRCSYCSTELIEGCLIRKRSPASVVQWFSQWVEAAIRRFHFVDNIFNLPPSYARELCSRISESGLDITWRAIVYPCRIDPTLVKEMARAGCAEVALGFESGSGRILKEMNKRFDREDVRQAARVFEDYGIQRMGFLMLGGPGETMASVEEGLSFVDSLDLDIVKITLGIRIYPFTKLAKTAREEGVIKDDDPLLFPRFYMAKGLEGLKEMVAAWIKDRPHWVL